MLNRRALLTGIIAAPLVAKATNLMPIRIPIIPVTGLEPWLPCDGRELLTRQYTKLAQALGDIITTTVRTPTFRLPDLRPMSYLPDINRDVICRYEIATGEGFNSNVHTHVMVNHPKPGEGDKWDGWYYLMNIILHTGTQVWVQGCYNHTVVLERWPVRPQSI